MNRLTAPALIVAVLAMLFVVDVGIDDDGSVQAPQPISTADFPMVSPTTDVSSTWFCAGGTADEEQFADHSVIVANPADESVTVTVTVYGGVIAQPSAAALAEAATDPNAPDPADADGEGDEPVATTTPSDISAEPVVRELEIDPRTSTRLRLGDVIVAPIASALVEADRGGIVVEHEVRSVHGFDAKPCATTASDEWHFAWGRTTVDARQLLVLFNPFPDDAIIDGRFSTESGVREPLRFDGLVVPARSTVALDVGDDVTRRSELAASLRLRTGRVVVDRIVRRNGDGGPRGLTVQTGVPTPQDSWVFPDGFTSEVISETYVVYNPGAESAEVEIEIFLDDPATNGIPEPVELTVGPGAHASVELSVDGRLPDAVAHAGIVRSLNGEPIVAERVLAATGAERTGISVTTGSPVVATTWNFSGGEASDTVDEWLYVLNLDPAVIAELDVFAVAGGQLLPVNGLQGFEVAPGTRAAIALNAQVRRSALPLVVVSSEPVVVERGLYIVGEESPGLSNAVGIPDAASATRPPDPLDAAVDPDLGEFDVPDDDIPVAPDDVELPEPDEVIDVDDLDPDANPDDATTTSEPTAESSTTTTDPSATTAPGGVPDTTPPSTEPTG